MLASCAASPERTPAARKRAVDAIAFIRDESAAEAMAQLASSGPEDVRPLAAWWLKHRAGNDWHDFAAVEAFATDDAQDDAGHKKRQADLETMLDAGKALRTRERAMGRLARNADGGKLLIALAADGKFPKDLAESVVEPIHHNPDLSIRAMAGTYFPRKTVAGQTLPPVAELAKMPGDAARGRAVFFGNTASCSRCHAFNGEGRDVGPDLTAIRTKYQRPELLDAILNPSAGIAFGYDAWIIQTSDGEVFSGFILADAEVVVLKESTGEQRQISKAKIKKRVKQPMSVMPDNVGLGLTAQELADVAEFLLKAPTTAARQ
jgi:putative heme-binding domain-containing protein